MGKYDILKVGYAAERTAGMAAQAMRKGSYRLMALRPDDPGLDVAIELEGYDEPVAETVVLGGLTLEHCVVTAQQTKRVVRTAINGMAGTVKEWVSDGDVAIGLTVTLLNKEGNDYPWDAVEQLMRVLSESETQTIESRWLNDVWAVTRVVVEGYKMSGRTERNYEVVEVSLSSDKEYLIEELMEV